MSLSTGTLNLKFMQRAAARKAETQPGSAPSTPTPASGTESASGPSRLPAPGQGPSDTPASAPDSERWFINRLTPNFKGKDRERGTGWVFDNSYMSFLSDRPGAGEGGSGSQKLEGESASTSTSTIAGGGRMRFGGFGIDPEPEPEEQAEDEGDGANRRNGRYTNHSPSDSKRLPASPPLTSFDSPTPGTPSSRPPKPSPLSQPPSEPRTFQRPKGFSPPPGPKVASERKHRKDAKPPKPQQGTAQPEQRISAADKLRQTILAARKPADVAASEAVPPPATVKEEKETKKGKEKAKQKVEVEVKQAKEKRDEKVKGEEQEVTTGTKRKNRSSEPAAPAPSSLTGATLDEREAQRRAERKERKKQKKLKEQQTVKGD